MKALIVFFVALFGANVALADRIACTTRFLNIKTSKGGKVKICGAVALENARDNGIKYRKRPRFCNKFLVEFMSVRQGNESKFTQYCDKIFQKNCYVIKIKDDASREGVGGLSSHMVFASVKTIPTIFSLNAGAVGHKTGGVGTGRLVRMNLSCRVTR